MGGTALASKLKTQVEHLSDPKVHDFSDDFRLDLPNGYTRDELLDCQYEINTEITPGHIDVHVDIIKSIGPINVNVTIGD